MLSNGHHFSKLKKGHNSKKKLVDFTLNRTWPTFYDYIPVYKIWIQYTYLFKRYQTETIFQLFFNIDKGP